MTTIRIRAFVGGAAPTHLIGNVRLRRGTATLEFALATPLFVLLFGAVFSVFVAGASLLDLQRDTRRAAWSARFEPPPGTGLGLGGVPPLGRIANVPTDSGLITRQRRRRVG